MFEKTKLLSSILALTMIFICFELFISGYAPYVVVMGAIFAVVFVGMNAISIYIKK